MASAEASLTAELASVKKLLSKIPLNALATSEALADALRLITQRTLPEYHFDQLSLLSVLLKQLRQALPLVPISELDSFLASIRDTLNPAVQTEGIIAELIIINLESQTKANLIKAIECVHTLARLAGALLTYPDNVLDIEPLFAATCKSGLINKPALLLVENLLEAIPAASIPSDLLTAILEGMELPDNGVIRTNIIIGILSKRNSTSPIPSDEIIDLVLPLLDSSSSMHLTNNVNRYLLPALFKTFPHILLPLLSKLSEGSEDTFSSWISIASLGISLGILTVDQIPSEDLHDALGHEDAAVRLKAYDAITGCKDSGLLLTEGVMALVREALEVNAILPGSGARSDFASATYTFFTNLKTASNLAKRKQRKPNADISSSSPEAKSLEILQRFHIWFINNFIDPALVSARRIPVYRPLFALKLLEVYVSVFGDDEAVREILFTERMVKLLIGCQASEFTEVRGRARTILGSSPIPLPGYPSIDSPNARALLHSAYDSFSNPRRTQNDAAVAGLCIMFEKVLLPLDKAEGKESVAFVDELIDKLEKELKRGEEGISKGVDDLALHGLLSAARALLGCADMRDPISQVIWKAPMHRLVSTISRVWNLTRTIMSLTSSSLEEKEEGPAHEIAKAHQLLSNAQDEDDDGEVDTRKILSACWRATKEASDLLSLIISQPILQACESQVIWTKQEVHQAGQQYLVWMHEIRHRGTFSKVALAFAALVEAVKTVPSIRDLAGLWLQLELEAITDDTLSTTRRSAALPYSLLSIVAGDQALLDIAIDRLIDLARLDNISTSDITRVHGFNILKIVLLDSRQTKLFGIYFERTVMTAVAAFSSANWNVRNVGLILFSTLVHRSLTPSRGSPDIHANRSTLASRQTFIGWHTKYPSLLPYSIKYMGELKGTHTPLFPMLIIIRSLRWSEKGGEVQDGLKIVVRPHLGSSERQVREVAAQALSSLFSPAEALAEILSEPRIEKNDLNGIHGRLIYTRNLIAGVIDWSTISPESKDEFESLLLSKLQEYTTLPCPPIRTEILLCISKYLTSTNPTTKFFNAVVTSAEEIIKSPRSLLPGNDALLSAAADLVLTYRPSPQNILSLLDHPAETGRLVVLDRLMSLPGSLTEEVIQQVMRLAVERKSGEAVQVAELNLLAEMGVEATRDKVSVRDWTAFLDGVMKLLQAKCIPLREAVLPAAAWAVSRSWESSTEGSEAILEKIAREINDASLEIQSQPRRETSIKSLLHLTSFLFPTSSPSTINTNILLVLHQSLLRLLQDDDEDVRLIASDLVRDGMGLKRSVTQSKAVEGWWAWSEGFMGHLEAKAPWIRWMEELALSKQDLEEELVSLQPNKIDNRAYTSADLFAEEKPNLWRDPLDDARHASIILAKLRGRSESDRWGEARQMMNIVKVAMEQTGIEGVSPIDEGYKVLGILPEYLAVLERISA